MLISYGKFRTLAVASSSIVASSFVGVAIDYFAFTAAGAEHNHLLASVITQLHRRHLTTFQWVKKLC
jgi:hypothetical protein